MRRYLQISGSFCILLALMFLSACFALPVEDPVPTPPLAQIPQAPAMLTSVVMRGDVVHFFNPVVSYVPAKEEQLAFDLYGFRILGIYVNVGDYVEEGDIVASLYWPEIQSQLTAALRQEEWVQLSISHLERRHQHARTHRSVSAEETTRFRQERDRLERELEILEIELEYLNRQNERRFLRAGINGTVSRVIFFTEGMLSNRLFNVVTIVDQTQSLFVARHSRLDAVTKIGEYFTLYVNRNPYLAVVVDPDEFGVQRQPLSQDMMTEMYLVIVGEEPIHTGRLSASLSVVLDVAEDVLFVPVQAVQHGTERVFVYVVDDNGMRVVRDVELGLRGNNAYEIISGLKEGELVVIG